MIKQLRRKLILNLALIFILLIVLLICFYFFFRIKIERSTSHSMSVYMSKPIDMIRSDEKTPSLFIVTIENNIHENVLLSADNNILKNFNILYIDDSFSTSQINNILSRIIENSSYISTIRVGERHYKYMKKIGDEKIRILVLDITKKIIVLKYIAYSLWGIAIISIIIICFIVKLITNHSIKSVELITKKQMDFISEICHELKAPLTTAITNLAVVKSHKEETVQSQEKWLGYIQYQLDRLSDLTDKTLILEQVNLSEQKSKEYFNISLLLNRHMETMEALINQKNISLNKNIEENVYIKADKELITRVISILIDNAIKYTPEKGVITITLYQSRKNIFMVVENTGQGIEEEYIDRIFDRFYQINRSNCENKGGSGLGLTIAKSIVENINGGKISVESNVGESTTFYVTFPQAE